jgi:hypothetical protein
LRPNIGKESLVKSLKTSDRGKANRLASPYIADFKARLVSAANAQRYDYNGGWGPCK